jgi:hypothetical protein
MKFPLSSRDVDDFQTERRIDIGHLAGAQVYLEFRKEWKAGGRSDESASDAVAVNRWIISLADRAGRLLERGHDSCEQ